MEAVTTGKPTVVDRAMRAPKRVGRQTVRFQDPPVVAAGAAVVGPKEGQGPLGAYFDRVYPDTLLGEQSWERAECRMLVDAVRAAAGKAGLGPADIDLLFAGDLLNQTVTANFAARELDIPFLGIFNACSTLTEGLGLSAMVVDGGYADRVVTAVSSHHDTAERQYRFPTEFGAQKPLTSQWTVTGAAALLVARPELAAGVAGPRITHATFGRVVDMGVKDPFDMGSAMAPAAADTIRRHFEDTGRRPEDYDLVVTGDLAQVGLPIARDLLRRQGLDLADRLADCGLIFFGDDPQVHAGASGAACSGTVLAAYLLPRLREGRYRRILMVSTGALFSKTTYQQGESIPCIAHAVALEAGAP